MNENGSDNSPAAKVTEEAWRKLQEQSRQLAAAPRNRAHPPRFNEICKAYVIRDTWTLEEAALLLCACDPNRGTYQQDQHELNASIKRTSKFLQSCLGVSLTPIEPRPRIRIGQTRFPVSQFHALATAKNLDLPTELENALNETFNEPKSEHGNKRRFEQNRQAARKRAEELREKKPRRFQDNQGKANVNALAKHLASHPEEWAPNFQEGKAAPLHAEQLKKVLREYFRGR